LPPVTDAVFDIVFREDLVWWITNDRKTALRLMRLVEAIIRDPFQGLGKPEPLKRLGSNMWSRRLMQEHRVVYHVSAGRITFLQARYHY
jgi:toxin YoeB